MPLKKILSALWQWIKKSGMVLLGSIAIAVEFLLALLGALHIGERLAQSKLVAKLGLKLTPRQLERAMCLILCLVMLVFLLSRCGSGSSGGGGGASSLFDRDCSACSGSGDCRHCSGSGKESNWVAGTRDYLIQDCRFCIGSGDCSFCNGSGR